MVGAVADALKFQHMYTSGVITLAPEDRPTGARIEAALDKTAWAGSSRTAAPGAGELNGSGSGEGTD